MTTFDSWYPGDTFVSLRGTLSGSNLTFTGGAFSPAYSNTNPALVQTVEGKSAGKWYWEITIGGSAFNNVGCAGLAPCIGLFQGFGLGFNTSPSGFGYFPSNGSCFADGTAFSAIGSTYGVGDVISFALDLTNKRIWCRKNGGNWCGTSGPNGVADPVANVQGFDVSASVNVGRVFAACQLVDTSAAVTANFGSSAFAHSVPSGYGGWTNTAQLIFGSLWSDEVSQEGQLPAGGVNSETGPWIAPATGTITGVIGVPVTAHAGTHSQAFVYDDTGTDFTNSPGALLGSSDINVNLAQGENFYNFSTPVAIVSGTKYWIGVICDGNTGTYFSYNNQCTNGAPHANMTGTGSLQNPWVQSGSPANERVPILIEYALGANDGTIAQTLGGVTQALTGTVAIPPGTIAQTLGRVTQALAGSDLGDEGNIAQTLGGITQKLVGADLSSLAKLRQLWAF